MLQQDLLNGALFAASVFNNVGNGASSIHVDKCSTKIFRETATTHHGSSKRQVLSEPKRGHVDNHFSTAESVLF